MGERVVHVAQGHDHPSLLTTSVQLAEATWIAGAAPPQLSSAHAQAVAAASSALGQEGRVRGLACSFKAAYRQPQLGRALVRAGAEAVEAFRPSKLHALLPVPSHARAVGTGASKSGCWPESAWLVAHFPDGPLRGLAPLQVMALYDAAGTVCLGSALMLRPGATLFDNGPGA